MIPGGEKEEGGRWRKEEEGGRRRKKEDEGGTNHCTERRGDSRNEDRGTRQLYK
jgi:hypothetical protein